MAIDYMIDYDCVPKQILSSDGIIERLKGQDRANTIIRLYREAGDQREPSEMGFELTRSTPAGEEETELIVVQDILDQVAELEPLAHHCQGCPANRRGKPFGCTGFIQYPVSSAAESWLLNRLPVPDEALVWLLLKRGVEDFAYDGRQVATLRAAGEAYFQDRRASIRRLGEFDITADQVFEMLFAVGNIIPNHAGVLMLFFHAIPRDLEAPQIINLSPARLEADGLLKFRLVPEADDDLTIDELKQFFEALFFAWQLNVRLLVDS